jgi:hypothetical protein
MDLGTIKSKLRERKYNDPREFAADVRLVWRNCATYNAVGTPARASGDQLSEDWERKWAELNVEQRWDELVATRDPQVGPCVRCCGLGPVRHAWHAAHGKRVSGCRLFRWTDG